MNSPKLTDTVVQTITALPPDKLGFEGVHRPRCEPWFGTDVETDLTYFGTVLQSELTIHCLVTSDTFGHELSFIHSLDI